MAFGSFQLAGKEATAAQLKKTKKKKALSVFPAWKGRFLRGGEGGKKSCVFQQNRSPPKLRSRLQLCCSALLKLLLGGDGEMNAPVNSVWQPDIKALKAEGHD